MDGNMSDSDSLLTIIEDLSVNTSHLDRKPVVVIDAGITSEKNLKLLKDRKFNYIFVSRSGLQNYSIVATSQPVEVNDNKRQILMLQNVEAEGCLIITCGYIIRLKKQKKKV